MLTKQKDELYQLYVVYDSYSNYEDIEIVNKMIKNFNINKNSTQSGRSLL